MNTMHAIMYNMSCKIYSMQLKTLSCLTFLSALAPEECEGPRTMTAQFGQSLFFLVSLLTLPRPAS
jgi:hypothetical protein